MPRRKVGRPKKKKAQTYSYRKRAGTKRKAKCGTKTAKSKIMKKAWAIHRSGKVSMSVAMKRAHAQCRKHKL